MKELTDESLLDTYLKALDLQLDIEFIKLLEQEIKRRRLPIAAIGRASLQFKTGL